MTSASNISQHNDVTGDSHAPTLSSSSYNNNDSSALPAN